MELHGIVLIIHGKAMIYYYYMELYDSINGKTWSCMESHVALIPYMELHGSLMNSHQGTALIA